jgi:hypothetical protein
MHPGASRLNALSDLSYLVQDAAPAVDCEAARGTRHHAASSCRLSAELTPILQNLRLKVEKTVRFSPLRFNNICVHIFIQIAAPPANMDKNTSDNRLRRLNDARLLRIWWLRELEAYGIGRS